MSKKRNLQKSDAEKLDIIITLLQTLVAIELAKSGISQPAIGKLLGIAAGSVNKLINGYKPNKK